MLNLDLPTLILSEKGIFIKFTKQTKQKIVGFTMVGVWVLILARPRVASPCLTSEK